MSIRCQPSILRRRCKQRLPLQTLYALTAKVDSVVSLAAGRQLKWLIATAIVTSLHHSAIFAGAVRAGREGGQRGEPGDRGGAQQRRAGGVVGVDQPAPAHQVHAGRVSAGARRGGADAHLHQVRLLFSFAARVAHHSATLVFLDDFRGRTCTLWLP